MFYVYYCNFHWAFNCNWLYMYTYDEHVYFDSLLNWYLCRCIDVVLCHVLWCIYHCNWFLCPSCSHTQPTDNITAHACLKCLFYMHSLTVHNCINVSVFSSSLSCVWYILCAASCQSRSTAAHAESYHCTPVLLTPMTFTTRQLHSLCELYLRSPALHDEQILSTLFFFMHTHP